MEFVYEQKLCNWVHKFTNVCKQKIDYVSISIQLLISPYVHVH